MGSSRPKPGYPASPSLVIQYSHTQYLLHAAIIKEQKPTFTPIKLKATYRKNANSLWNSGKLTMPQTTAPVFPEQGALAAEEGATKTQSYVLPILTLSLCSDAQTAATQREDISQPVWHSKGAGTHLVSHKAWASCGKGVCSPGWGRCWCSLYLQQEGLGCGTQVMLDEEDLRCCGTEMFRNFKPL